MLNLYASAPYPIPMVDVFKIVKWWLPLVFLLATSTMVHAAQDASSSVEILAAQRIDQALSGGLQATDFPALAMAFEDRRHFAHWPAVSVLLDRLSAARSADPLMVDEVRLMRARINLELGRSATSRELFRTMGGITRWWAAGPSELEELEDFGRVATHPPESTQWRPAAGTDPLGWVQLQGLAWPARRQLLFLATTIQSDDEQPAALRLGVAQVARVWVNGEMVLTTDHPLRAAEDQVSTGCWLRRGPNMLVVAVASESADWWLRARLTAPDGSSLAEVEELDRPPKHTPPVDRPAPHISTLEQQLRKALERNEPGARLALAALLVDRSSEPKGSGGARSACRDARSDDPIAARYFELLVTTEAGIRRDLLEEAVDAGGAAIPFRTDLARWYHARGLHDQAHSVITNHLEIPAVRALAYDLEANRWGQILLPKMQRFVEQHPECLEAILVLARQAKHLKRWQLLKDTIARGEILAPGHLSVETLAFDAARQCGDDQQLQDRFRRALDRDPNNPMLRERLARLFAADGRMNAAEDLLKSGLQRCPTHVDLLMESAYLQHRLGRDDEASRQARDVLALRPQSNDAEQLLQLLGRSEEHEHWRLPVEDLRRMSAEADHLEGSAVTLVDSSRIRFLPGNLTEKRVQQVFFVRDAARSRSLQIHRVPYVAESQRLRILAARAIHRDGGETGARRRDTPRLAEPEFNLYYDTRLRILRFDDLADGDLIEIAYELTETLEANETGAYEGGILRLGTTSPTLQAQIELVASPDQMPKWELVHLQGQPEQSMNEDGTLRLSWSFADLPAMPSDVPPAPLLTVQPHLVYSNHSRWGDLADWYDRHVAPRIRASREVEAKAQELIDGYDERSERIARIYRFVTNDIRYVGLEFGEHRYRPFSADWVLTHKMGDCKDTAGLLVALFSSIGIPARMVMIRTSDLGPVPAELAAMQFFNHAIAYLPEDDLWLDGTAAGHDPYPPPGIDQNAWVMVVDGPRSEPELTPDVGAGTWGYHYDLKLLDNDRFDLTIRTEDTGEAATRRRGRFAGRRNLSVFSRWLQTQFPGAELVGEPKLSLSPGTNPVVMEVRAEVDLSSLLAAGGLKTYPGSFDLDTELTPTAERSSPLQLPVRPDLSWTVSVTLPGGAPELPEPTQITSPYGSLQIDYESNGSGFTSTSFFHMNPVLVAAEENASLRQFLIDVRRALDRRIEVR